MHVAADRILLNNIQQIILLFSEAMADCGHLNSIEEIQTCINDILAATDCQKCICDALPGICGKH